MVSSHTRNLVWQDYLDVTRFVRYYGALARRYNFFRRCFHFILIMPLFSATELVIDKFPNWVDAIVGLVIVVAVVVELIWKFTDKAIIAKIVCTESIKLEREWSNLWTLLNKEDSCDEEIEQKNSQLSDKIDVITIKAFEFGIYNFEKLNKKCTDEAFKELSKRYEYSSQNSTATAT